MSKFGKLFEARNSEAEAVAVKEEVEESPPSPAPVQPRAKPESKPRAERPEKTPPASLEVVKKVGRPRGKRSDGEYVQVTAYVRGDTHRDVKVALLKDGNGLDFSELVEDLLAKWLKSRR